LDAVEEFGKTYLRSHPGVDDDVLRGALRREFGVDPDPIPSPPEPAVHPNEFTVLEQAWYLCRFAWWRVWPRPAYVRPRVTDAEIDRVVVALRAGSKPTA
jgi:hypothetical protein